MAGRFYRLTADHIVCDELGQDRPGHLDIRILKRLHLNSSSAPQSTFSRSPWDFGHTKGTLGSRGQRATATGRCLCTEESVILPSVVVDTELRPVVGTGVFLRRGQGCTCAGVDFQLVGVGAAVECDEGSRALGSRFERSGQLKPVTKCRPRLVSEAALSLEHLR